MMSFKQLLYVIMSAVLILAAPVIANEQPGSKEVSTPASVIDVVYIQPFTLAKGYKFTWNKEQPITNSGFIVVLRVNPDLVVPTNEPAPILYAGNRMVHSLNQGHRSGHVIGIISGAFDFAKEPIWFGRPRLPGQATSESIKSERASAKANIRPFTMDRIERVTHATLQAPDLVSLLRGEIAELVLKYSPQESDLARKWRLPEAKAKPSPGRPVIEESEGGL